MSEYDQEIPQAQTADKPMAPRGRATQQPRGTWRPTNQSSSLPKKMIAKPEWTQSNAQQNTEQLQNPTPGATRFSLFVATSVIKQWFCATLIVYHVIC